MTSKADKTIIHLKKAKSLLAGAIVMVEQDAPPVEIMQQIGVAIGLLRSSRQLYVENYLEECSRKATHIKSPKKRMELFQEILKVTKMYSK